MLYDDNDDILAEAYALTAGDRQSDYAHPSVNLGRTAAIWSVILKTDISAQQVALCMIGVKIARQVHKETRDNIVDIAGWARCAQLCIEAQMNAENKALL